MSTDLIALIVAATLGAVVVGAGLRRSLGDTTRDWLPRFGEASEQTAVTHGPSLEGHAPRRLSARQRRRIAGGSLLVGLLNAAMALAWASDRLMHAVLAALWTTLAVAYFLGKWPPSVRRSAS